MKRLMIFLILIMSVALFATSTSNVEQLDDLGINLPISMDLPSVPVQLEPQPNVPIIAISVRVFSGYVNTSYTGPKMIQTVPIESWRLRQTFSFYTIFGSGKCVTVNNS